MNAPPQAPFALSLEEAELFRRQGFLGPFTALPPEEMESFGRIITERVLTTPTPYSNYPVQVRHLDSAAVWRLCSLPAIVDRMASLYGPDLVLWYSNVFDKPPAEPERQHEYPWHQDMMNWKLEPMLTISAWLAVTPATVENGCVEIVPGTHRKAIPLVHDTDARYSSWFGGRVADPASFSEASRVTMELTPGQFFLFNERTLHRSGPNRTRQRRLGLSVRVTVPFVKTYETWPCLRLRGRDPLGVNAYIEPPVSDPDLENWPSGLPDAENFVFERSIPGLGWHAPENDRGRGFCWMAEKNSWVELRADGRGERLFQCQILHVLAPQMLQGLQIRVNDHPLTLNWREGSVLQVEARVPEQAFRARPGRAKVAFHIPSPTRPCDVNSTSGDTRVLGIGVHRISLTSVM
jgi:Phytanoyl-CoA dioxygenase (PhyH)